MKTSFSPLSRLPPIVGWLAKAKAAFFQTVRPFYDRPTDDRESNQVHTYQSKGSEDGEAGDVGEAELDQRKRHDDKVKDVPAFLEVVLWTHGHQLDARLDSKRRSKKLKIVVGNASTNSFWVIHFFPVFLFRGRREREREREETQFGGPMSVTRFSTRNPTS